MLQNSPTILLVSSNGAGMGHLTRLLAYARRLPGTVTPFVLSMSQAVPVVEAEGLAWEYLPSQGASGLRPSVWRQLFASRMDEILSRLEPAVMVFDGAHPYAGLDRALAAHPATRSVWSRRGMWKRRHSTDQLLKSAWFDTVVEPGDLAINADRGPTSTADDAVRTRPVTLLDPHELVPRTEAREALGLPSDGPLALITLGAGNLNDPEAEIRAAISHLRRLGIGACVTVPTIADRTFPGEVHVTRRYPLSRYYRAFDYAISAAGYNSFHELLRFGVPTLFVPNTRTSLDDQVSRASWSASAGCALSLPTLTDARGRLGLEMLIEDAGSLSSAALAADPGNGAEDAAAMITGLVR